MSDPSSKQNNYIHNPIVRAPLSPALDAELEVFRKVRGLSRADVVRDALRHYLAAREGEEP